MRTLLRIGALLAVNGCAWGAYQFYLTDPLTAYSLNGSIWAGTGSVNPAGPPGIYMGAGGGSLISEVPIPDGASDGEVRIAVNVTASYTGATTLFRARNTWLANRKLRNGHVLCI